MRELCQIFLWHKFPTQQSRVWRAVVSLPRRIYSNSPAEQINWNEKCKLNRYARISHRIGNIRGMIRFATVVQHWKATAVGNESIPTGSYQIFPAGLQPHTLSIFFESDCTAALEVLLHLIDGVCVPLADAIISHESITECSVHLFGNVSLINIGESTDRQLD